MKTRKCLAMGGVFAVVALCTLPSMAVEIISGPTLTMDPNGVTPLAGVVELQTAAAELPTLRISGNGDSWTVDFADADQVHYLPVLGMKPDRTYTVELLFDGVVEAVMMAVTPPLPADFPTLAVQVSDPGAMQPGYTLLDCFGRAPGDMRPRYTMIVDDAGEVVWYTTVCAPDWKQLRTGNLFRIVAAPPEQPAGAREMDMLGSVMLDLNLADPGSRLHHDIERTPMGTYVSLSYFSVDVEDFPTSDQDPNAPTALTQVRDEPVVEFLPDGSLRNWWLLTDILAPTRIAYDSLIDTSQGKDWAHTNAVVWDPRDDSFIVSARHQDAVFKFSRSTGELIWILGPHDNWPAAFEPYLLHPVGTSFRWQFHQHAPMITGEGNLVLYDNGNHRTSPFDGQIPIPDEQNFSRAVEYEINEQTMTVRQVWEYGENVAEPLYTPFICDADWQANGNVLMTFGAVTYAGGVASADLGRGAIHARIIETTDDIIPVPVFDLAVYDDSGPDTRVTIFRSERIKSLYPPEHLQAPNGIGDTLIAGKVSAEADLSWAAPPLDSAHSAADFYIVFQSASPSGGFQMMDTFLNTGARSRGNATYYKIVAANEAGTSGDEPAP